MKIDFPSFRGGVAYLALWTLMGVIFFGQSVMYALLAGRPVRTAEALVSTFAYWYLWAFLGLLVQWLARMFPIGETRNRRNIALHVVLGTAIAGCHVLLRFAVEILLGGNDELRIFFVEQFHLDLLVYWGIVGAVHALAFHRQSILRTAEASAFAVRAANLETQIATTRLNALRAQLEPHFLFNTLQAVATLMREDVGLADRTLSQLSALLRRVVDTADVQEISLREELQLADEYLQIQATRFDTRLAVKMSIARGLENALVPTLLLQPLLENACMHGISKRPEGGTIEVRATELCRNQSSGNEQRVLRLSILNHAGPPELERASIREGVGLRNTTERLAALYGPEYGIKVERREPAHVETIVELPLRWASELRS